MTGFRVLVVCSGNVCRSPLAERLLRARLGDVFGSESYRLEVTSAGTTALVGSGMDPRAAAVATVLGVSPDGFRARALTAEQVAAADLVLGAAREHRAAAVRLHPPAHRYAFTLVEFGRLCAAVPVDTLPAGDIVARARALVAAAAVRRGTVRPPRPEDDDVQDPRGGQDRVHREVGAVLEQVAAAPAAALAGVVVEQPALPGPSRAGAARSAYLPGGSRAGSRSGGSRSGSRSGGSRAGSRSGGSRAGSAAGSAAGGPRSRASAARAGAGRGRPRGRSGPVGRSSAAGPSDPAGRRRSGDRRRAHRRARVVALRGGLGLLALLVLAGGWVALRGLQAQRELVAARADVTTLRTALLAGDVPAARTALADAQRRSGRARDLTGDPVWRAAGAAPLAGANPAAVRTVAAAVDDLARDALPALVQAGAALDPATLRPAGDRVALAGFTAAAPALRDARSSVVATGDRLAAVDQDRLLAPVGTAVSDLRRELTDTARTLDGVGRAARLAPAMLGADGRRRYLVVFQNNAEARATGGLVGAYAVVTADAGRLRVERIGSNTDLRSAGTLPVDLGRDFRAAWGDTPALWANGNLDANFPNAARIWLALWKKQTGQALDGVLATDPVALGYLLQATGPVRLPTGETIGPANAARLTMHDVYARSADNAVRDGYLRSVAGRVVDALVAGRGGPRAVLDQLGRAAGERRLMLYSVRPAEQRDLAGSTVSGILSGRPGPYAYVAVNNAAGNKMDYYLRRTFRYEAGRCTPDGRRTSRVTLTFGNAAPDPARLPEYVSQRLDAATATRSQSVSDGSVADLVSVYGPLRGGVLRATLDGRPMTFASNRSGPRPVWTFPLVVEQGRSRTVVLDVLEPASAAAPVVPVQPLVRAADVSVSTTPCGLPS